MLDVFELMAQRRDEELETILYYIDHPRSNMACTLTTGSTDGHAYVGVLCGRVEYRIFEDREGWFVAGEYTAENPKGSSVHAIRNALDCAQGAFKDYLAGKLEKWELKEKAGI